MTTSSFPAITSHCTIPSALRGDGAQNARSILQRPVGGSRTLLVKRPSLGLVFVDRKPRSYYERIRAARRSNRAPPGHDVPDLDMHFDAPRCVADPTQLGSDPTISNPFPHKREGLQLWIEQGLIEQPFVAGSDLLRTTMMIEPAHLHEPVERLRRPVISTNDHGFSRFTHVKFDVHALEQMDPNPSSRDGSATQGDMEGDEDPDTDDSESDEDGSPFPVAGKQRDSTRTYTQLLDQFSLHEFIIRRGVALTNTPEFMSYKRTYAKDWGAISEAIAQLEVFLNEYQIPLAYVDGKQLAFEVRSELGTITDLSVLLSCIVNKEEILQQMNEPSRRQAIFASSKDFLRERSAIRIQCVVRAFFARKAYRLLMGFHRAARCIQTRWFLYRSLLKTRERIKSQHKTAFDRWQRTMQAFCAEWASKRTTPRVVIHLPSLSINLGHHPSCVHPFHSSRQNEQFARIFESLDHSGVEVVYIAPYNMEAETLRYYFQVGAAAGLSDLSQKVRIMVPENLQRFERAGIGSSPDRFGSDDTTLSLTQALLLSPRTLKMLTQCIRGRYAYMIPAAMSPDEVTLAVKLNVPLYAPRWSIFQRLSSRSELRTLCNVADASSPVGTASVHSETQIVRALAHLIASHPEFPRWLIKLNGSIAGRGHALIDVRRLRLRSKIRSDPVPQGSSPALTHVPEETLMLYQELCEVVPQRVQFMAPHLFPAGWESYMGAVQLHGAVVEAVPGHIRTSVKAHFEIEPDGTIRIHAMQEMIVSEQYNVVGLFTPISTIIPYDALREVTLSIARGCRMLSEIQSDESVELKRKQVQPEAITMDVFSDVCRNATEFSGPGLTMGFYTVDYIIFHKVSANGPLRLWCTDVEPYLTSAAVVHRFFRVLSPNSTYNTHTGEITGQTLGGTECRVGYTYAGLLFDPLISTLRHGPFFRSCKERSLCFSMRQGTGIIFHLVDVILRGCFGALYIGKDVSPHEGIQKLIETVDFLQQQLKAVHYASSSGRPWNMDPTSSNISVTLHALRRMLHHTNQHKVEGNKRK